MNVTPVNNNSQSFGMAFKLHGDGAKKLATLLDEVAPETKEHIMEDLINPIHFAKASVLYDGDRVFLNGLPVSADVAVARPHTGYKDIQYKLGNGIYHVIYDEPTRKLVRFMQKLYNAREIAKDLDAKAAKSAYEAQLTAEKQARIEESAKKLQDMFG